MFDDGHNVVYGVNSEYSNGKRLWQDVSLSSGWNTLGRAFNIQGINRGMFDRINQDYAYIYCPPELDKKECNKKNGIILYEGNAIDDCGTGRGDKGYFSPYNNFIELSDEQSNKSNSDIEILKKVNLKESDFPRKYTIVDKYSGYQTNALYFSDLNKLLEEELIKNGWAANYTINVAEEKLDSKLTITIPSESVYASISKYIYKEKELADDTDEEETDFNKIYENRMKLWEAIAESYSDAGYNEVTIEQLDSNTIIEGKIFFFSSVNPDQALGEGVYNIVELVFYQGNFSVYLIVEGYSKEVTPQRIDEYAEKILERMEPFMSSEVSIPKLMDIVYL